MQQFMVQRLNTEEFRQEDINKFIETIKIRQISCGYYHIILLDQNNNIYTCGRNSDGQLGLGHKNNLNNFEKVCLFDNSVKLIAAGGYCSMVVTLDNKIYGTGSILSSYLTNNVLLAFKEIKLINEKEDNNDFKKIKCGGGFAMLMNNKNELFGCGSNHNNQLGEPIKGMESNVVKLKLPTNLKVKEFHCGYLFSLLLTQNGEVYFGGTCSYKSNAVATLTKLDLNFKCKEIGGVFSNFYLLSDNNELYFNETKLNFTKPIKRLTFGLGPLLYLLTDENEIYKVEREKITKFNEFTFYLKHLYIYPAYGMIVFLNSNFDLDEEESKEVIRMKHLLLNNVILSDIELKVQ